MLLGSKAAYGRPNYFDGPAQLANIGKTRLPSSVANMRLEADVGPFHETADLRGPCETRKGSQFPTSPEEPTDKP